MDVLECACYNALTMGSRVILMAVLSLQLAACSWGFESEGDAGSDDGSVAVDSDGGGGPDQPDADLTICDTSELSYGNFAQGFMDSYCLGCHSNTLNPGQRRGAPDSVNFDTFELVQQQADRIRVRAGSNQDMPPQSGAQPSNEERDSITEWIDCGLRQ